MTKFNNHYTIEELFEKIKGTPISYLNIESFKTAFYKNAKLLRKIERDGRDIEEEMLIELDKKILSRFWRASEKIGKSRFFKKVQIDQILESL